MDCYYISLWQKTYLPVFRVLGHGPVACPELDSLQNRANAMWEALSELQGSK